MIAYDDQLQHELESIVNHNPKNYITCIKSKGVKRKHEDRSYLIDYIMRCTPLLIDSDAFAYSLRTRLFWTLNKIQDWNDSRVKCTVCEKPFINCNVKKLHDGYKKTCCKQCERKLAQRHIEERLMEKHGVKNVFQLEYVAKKLEMQKFETQKKRDSTKRKNKTFKASKKEEDAYKLLCSVFQPDNVIRQFKDKQYPFNCDFYIKSQDLFIECNFSWTHGGHWFDSSSQDDMQRLKSMKAKKSKYYENAIETWTVRDVKKKQCAENNGLNYIVFWTFDEMLEHYARLT